LDASAAPAAPTARDAARAIFINIFISPSVIFVRHVSLRRGVSSRGIHCNAQVFDFQFQLRAQEIIINLLYISMTSRAVLPLDLDDEATNHSIFSVNRHRRFCENDAFH
jgi:hypothetical protein